MKKTILLMIFYCTVQTLFAQKNVNNTTEINNKSDILQKSSSANSVVTYDFTQPGSAYSNPAISTAPMVEVEAGVWAMWNGDANNDGSVTNADKAPINSAKVYEGYHSADLNWDGSVTNADKAIVNNNKPSTPQTHVPQ